jgi:hypothetical protein
MLLQDTDLLTSEILVPVTLVERNSTVQRR